MCECERRRLIRLDVFVCPAVICSCVYVRLHVLLEGNEDRLCQHSKTALPPLLSPLITSQLDRQEVRQDGDTSTIYQQRGKLDQTGRKTREKHSFVFFCVPVS